MALKARWLSSLEAGAARAVAAIRMAVVKVLRCILYGFVVDRGDEVIIDAEY